MATALLLFSILASTLPGSKEYLNAREAERQGKYAEAFKTYAACGTQEGPLQVYARARQAACQAASGDPKGAAAAYEGVLRDYPEGPWVRMVQADLAELYVRLGDSTRAAACYDEVLEGRFRSWWVQRFEWTAAEQFAAQPGTAPKAYAFFRQALENPSFRGRRCDAAEFLSKSSDTNDLWLSADALVRFGAVRSATPVVAMLSPLAATSPDARARWTYLEGRVLLGDGKADEGRALLMQVADQYKGSVWAGKALYQLMRNSWGANKSADSDEYLSRLLTEYPGSEELGDALWWRAAQYVEKEDFQSAIAEYLRLATLVPSHENTAEALLSAGDLLREVKKPKEALDAFQTLVRQYPGAKGRSEAAYWSGRLQENSPAAEQAIQSYRAALEGGLGDYYAARALARLRKLDAGQTASAGLLSVPGANLSLGLTKIETVSEAEPSCGADALARLRFFGASGLPEGEWEALYLAERQPAESPGLLTAMADAGYAHTAGQVADALGWGTDKGVPSAGRLRVMYPRAYWADVSLVAREAGLDPYLLLSVARQESTFRASIASSSGAQGVMQLMPATAAWLAEKEPGVSPEDAGRLHHPGSSLRLGAFYLSRMVAANDGNVALALAAYNAGPGNVRKWRRVQSTADTEDFIEFIPFGETRNYVKRVLGNLAAYRSIYGPAAEPEARR